MIKKIIAFTLFEVLMAAAIIGVVATLTVTNLRNSYDNKAMIAKGKSAMAKLDAAVQHVEMPEVCKKVFTFTGAPSNLYNASQELLDQMSDYIKKAGSCSTSTCFNEPIINGNTLNGYDNHGSNKCSAAILNDGTEFAVCILSNVPIEESTVLSNNQKYYGYIVADVNGSKNGPNERARDVYFYLITDNLTLAIPDGTSQTNYEMKTFKDGF